MARLDVIDGVARWPTGNGPSRRCRLMDCQMPVMDGCEATRRIRALEGPARTVPIVALTASVQREELEHCRTVGRDATLTKPLTSVALSQVLAQLWRDLSAR